MAHWTLALIALAATLSIELAPAGHPATNPATRGVALAVGISLPLLLIGGLIALVVWRLRGGKVGQRQQAALIVGICAFCVLASAITWTLRLT